MWDKVRKWGAATLAILVTLALAVGYALRGRAAGAEKKLSKGREEDALERGREEGPRARLQLIKRELDKKDTPAGKRTPAQVLAEQRRRGQVDE